MTDFTNIFEWLSYDVNGSNFRCIVCMVTVLVIIGTLMDVIGRRKEKKSEGNMNSSNGTAGELSTHKHGVKKKSCSGKNVVVVIIVIFRHRRCHCCHCWCHD